MINKIKHVLSSISTKILLIMIILVLPLNVIAVIYTDQAVKSIVDQVEYNIQKVGDYQMQQLGKQMDFAHAFLAYFSMEDADCIKLKAGTVTGYDYESAKMKVFSRVKNMAGITNGGDGYFYYYMDKSDGIIYGAANGESGFTTQIRYFLENYSDENNPRGWHIYQWDDKYYLVLLMKDKRMLYGSVIRLEPYLQTVTNDIEYPISALSMTEKKMQTTQPDMLTIRAPYKSLYMNIDVKRNDVLKNTPYAHQIFWNIAILYFMLIPVLYMILRRVLICPLMEVNEAHRQIEGDNGAYRIKARASSIEYGELYESFNKMADNLNRLKIESYEKEIARQKMELKNLQLQIRPHFLLNTFNIIFSLAQRKENEMVQKTIIYLSDYFRYIFRNEKELELFPKELKLIQGYVRTASIRYLGRVEAEYDFDPELDFVRVPPLLIHNFVENSVKYGIRQNEILHIWLQGRYDDGVVTISVEDDGKGMTPEMLERNRKIFSGELQPDDETSHIGLYNSLKRLKYFYGETAGIFVESQLDSGTCFTLCFPYNLEVEDE